VTYEEARQLVEVQRNGMLLEIRKSLTPFGKIYSEILKPAKSLPTLDQLLEKKGSIELVLESVGKTRASVNRIAFVAKRAGPAGIALEMVMTVVIIELTPEDQRAAATAKQVGGLVGSASFGAAGGWAGAWACSSAFVLAGSPTLAIPVVGEVTEGGLALVGGFIGFFALGSLGRSLGEEAGGNYWTLVHTHWQ
jgi:hypothetical protein